MDGMICSKFSLVASKEECMPSNNSTILPNIKQMCVLDYEFHILSNSFLIHREGIMRNSDNQRPPGAVEGQNLLAQEHILPALNRLFGARKGCRLLHF